MDEFFTWAAAARDLTPGRNLATRDRIADLESDPA